MIVLRSVTIRPDGPAPMKRKARGREIAGMVYACLLCGWESKPIAGAKPNFRQAEQDHACAAERFEGHRARQAAMVGPRFTHRDCD